MDKVTDAVRNAINAAPCSVRRLADAADVDHSLLVRIRSGERAATLDVAMKVQAALETWTQDCGDAARAIRRATKGGRQ